MLVGLFTENYVLFQLETVVCDQEMGIKLSTDSLWELYNFKDIKTLFQIDKYAINCT